MTPPLQLLRAIDDAHATMVTCAETLDWDGVARAWQSAEDGFVQLMQHPPFDRLPTNERAEAKLRIDSILSRQSQVATRARPWMEQTAPLLDSFSRHPLPPAGE